MRSAFVALVALAAAGCADDEGPPIGDVTVTVYTNATVGTHMFPGAPVADAYVFVEGAPGLVRTDAAGNATVPVSQVASTIHVLIDQQANRRLYTLTEIAVGTSIFVGGRPVSESAGAVEVVLPSIAGATYWLTTPGCVNAAGGSTPKTSPSFFVTYRATCAGRTVRMYGFAREPSGVEHVAEIDALLAQTLPTVGPYQDPVAYTIDVTNLPSDLAAITAVPAHLPSDARAVVDAGAEVTASITDATATVAGTAAPSANAIDAVAAAATTGSSRIVARHDFMVGTFDATSMVPLARSLTTTGASVAWDLDATGRTIDGFTLEATISDGDTNGLAWIVWGGPLTREIAVPRKVPAGVPLTLTQPSLPRIQLTYFDSLGQERPYDIERRGIAGPDGVASSSVSVQ